MLGCHNTNLKASMWMTSHDWTLWTPSTCWTINQIFKFSFPISPLQQIRVEDIKFYQAILTGSAQESFKSLIFSPGKEPSIFCVISTRCYSFARWTNFPGIAYLECKKNSVYKPSTTQIFKHSCKHCFNSFWWGPLPLGRQ